MTTGRNFDEIIRVLDSMLLTSKFPVATPANWKPGGDVIITGAVSNEDAEKKFPGLHDGQAVLAYNRHSPAKFDLLLPSERGVSRVTTLL